jgi:hypothetical protein
MYFEVLSNVYAVLKALVLLLDPVSGHIESPLANHNAKRQEKRVREKEEGPNIIISLVSCPFSLRTSLTPHFDPKKGQGVVTAI